MKIKLTVIFFFFLLSCKMPKNMPDKIYFKYYDLFTLKGKEPQETGKLTLPYVSIDTTGDSILIDHFLTKELSYRSTYFKKDALLYRQYEYNPGKMSLVYQEFIKTDKIFILEYDMTDKKRLSAMSIFADNRVITYQLDTLIISDITFDKGKEYVNSFKNYLDSFKMYSVTNTLFSQVNDSIQLETTFKNNRIPELSYSNKIEALKNYKEQLDWWLIYVWQSYNASMIYSIDKLLFASSGYPNY